MPVVPILGIVACVYQMYALPLGTWIRLVIWLALGMAIYFFYGIRNSRVQDRAAKTL
jgi:APA family basic amino acid/polyamine antiporter